MGRRSGERQSCGSVIVSATRDEPPPESIAVTVMSSVSPIPIAPVFAASVRRRSGGIGWPPEPPPPPPTGGGGVGGVGAVAVNATGLTAVPFGVVTLIGPVAAPGGTVADSSVADTTVNPAATPPNATAVVVASPVPVIATLLPTGPLVGEIELKVGAGGGGCGTGGAGGTR